MVLIDYGEISEVWNAGCAHMGTGYFYSGAMISPEKHWQGAASESQGVTQTSLQPLSATY